MPGEAMHQKGADGAQRAKAWLDATTRTRASWTNDDAVAAGRLTFTWPYGAQNEFSFDVGGILFGPPFDQHTFVAEVKNYSGDGLGEDFDDFLAKCYHVFKEHSKLATQFMFITWHPFRVKSWTKLTETEAILKACVAPKNRSRLLDAATEEAAKEEIDNELVAELCDRLWIVVLSSKQEQLLISNEDRALIIKDRVIKGLQ